MSLSSPSTLLYSSNIVAVCSMYTVVWRVLPCRVFSTYDYDHQLVIREINQSIINESVNLAAGIQLKGSPRKSRKS